MQIYILEYIYFWSSILCYTIYIMTNAYKHNMHIFQFFSLKMWASALCLHCNCTSLIIASMSHKSSLLQEGLAKQTSCFWKDKEQTNKIISKTWAFFLPFSSMGCSAICGSKWGNKRAQEILLLVKMNYWIVSSHPAYFPGWQGRLCMSKMSFFIIIKWDKGKI